MDSELAQKIVLVFIAFLLGLLADVIKRTFQRERRRITYSVNKFPIISVNQSLPDEVLTKLPTHQTLNVSNFRIAAENTGTQPVREANLLIVANDEAELLHHQISTNPAREVEYPSVEHPAANEIRFKGIKLERKQNVEIDLFLRSRSDPQIQTYWSGGDNIEWSVGSASEKFGLEGHLLSIIRFYILAQVIPAILGAIILIPLTFIPNVFEVLDSKLIMVGGTVTEIISSLIRFYFYLRIVPHAVAIIRDVLQRKVSSA